MANKQANAAQKQWLTDITDAVNFGGFLGDIYGEEFRHSSFQRHHVLGRSAKHNKIHIGHWFVIPVPFELHDVSSNHPLNVTHRKKSFISEFGKQSDLFIEMIEYMCAIGGYKFPNQDVIVAIVDTNA